MPTRVNKLVWKWAVTLYLSTHKANKTSLLVCSAQRIITGSGLKRKTIAGTGSTEVIFLIHIGMYGKIQKAKNSGSPII